MTTPGAPPLDPHARALLEEQGYFTLGQYRERTGLTESAAKRQLRAWCDGGLLMLHVARPPHYTLPDSPRMLGREARWGSVAAPLLAQRGRILPSEYYAAVCEQYGEMDTSGLYRDLAVWGREGRLQGLGKSKSRIYLPAGVDPREWAPEPGEEPRTRLERWAIVRRVAEEVGQLTISLLMERTGASESTAGSDLAAWVEEGWLERHGVGTHVCWSLPGRGPAGVYAPERAERVERLRAALAERGALTADDAAAHNHSALGQARRDLNVVVLMGEAVRVNVNQGLQMVWVALPLPEALAGVDWGEEALALARQEGRHEGRDEFLAGWQWKEMAKVLPATAAEAAEVWGVGRPAASQRLAVLEAASVLRRISGGRVEPDRFEAVA